MAYNTYSNPFIKSRVDSPFQHHPDLKSMHEKEYNFIKSLLPVIKADSDRQSLVVTMTGAPGAGKTHLAMRLANDLLSHNRLFYIRQPNNPESVLHFIYTKVLESLSENVSNSGYSQFSYFLARSISAILLKSQKSFPEDLKPLEKLCEDPLCLYKKFGEPGSSTKNKNWKAIEKTVLEWWNKKYGLTGLSPEIIKALIKYASQENPEKRQLIFRWLNGSPLSMEEADIVDITSHHTDIDHENFALEAITVLSRLSAFEEPMIMIFDQLEGLDYNPNLLISFFETIKEVISQAPNILFLFNICIDKWNRWTHILDPSIVDRLSQHILNIDDSPSEQKIEILEIRSKEAGAPLDIFFTKDEIKQISENITIRGMLISASHLFLNKTEGIPLPAKANTIEEKTNAKIKELEKEIKAIKKYLNIKSKSSSEQIYSKEIEIFLIQKRNEITRKKSHLPVYSEADDTGKLLSIAAPFIGISILETGKLKTSRKQLPEHILFKGKKQSIAAGFLHMSGLSLITRLKNLSSMCENYPEIKFYLMRDEPSFGLKSSGVQTLKEDLEARPNFRLFELSHEDRLNFELVYELLSAVKNLDLEVDEITALSIAKTLLGPGFIFEVLTEAGADF